MPATLDPPHTEVPKHAMHVASRAKIVQFADGNGTNELAVKLFARSPEAVEHWYWTKIAHDMRGFKLRKERLILDYCHDDVPIGFLDRFEASESRGLFAYGKLVSTAPGDKAAELIGKLKAGIPYESSIDFVGAMRVETVGAGMTAQCNGRTVTGEASIIREWTLNSVAICPYGVDPNTRTQFSASHPGAVVKIPVGETTSEIEALRLKGYTPGQARCILALAKRMPGRRA